MLNKLIIDKTRIWFLVVLFVQVSSLLAINVEIDGINYKILESCGKAVVIAKSETNYTGAINIPASIVYDGANYEVTKISDETFYKCSELTSVTLPHGIESIGKNAFRSCTNLTSVILPNSIVSIDEGAFRACSNLPSIIIPDKVKSIEFGTFSGCWRLSSISFGRELNSIGSYAFSDCSALTSVDIPSGVHTIEQGAFSGCSKLTTIKLPNTLTMVTTNAFSHCTNLLSVYCYAKDTPSAAEDAFEGCFLEEVTLYVPEASIEAYRSIEPWNKFGRFKSIPHGMENNDESTYYLVLWLKEGEKIYLPFDKKPRLTYDDGNILLRTSSNEVSYHHTDVKKFTIANEEGQKDDVAIDNLTDEQVQMSYQGESIVLVNCKAGESVQVYDIFGRLHKKYGVDNDGRLNIHLSQYTSGIYLIKIKNITYKFSKK